MLPQSFLENIRIVLVNTSHPGNIGAVARAMKTMGLKQLYLVDPQRFPDAQATERAASAGDILDQAKIFSQLELAIQDCTLVFGTSVRTRYITWPTLDCREAAREALDISTNETIAFVFGREQSGLTNEELELCHYQVEIPANPNYSSLNVAAAVQVICYELRMAALHNMPLNERLAKEPLSTVEELELFYEHLEQVLLAIKFKKPGLSGQILPRMRRLFSRTKLERTELNILRGILTAMENALK